MLFTFELNPDGQTYSVRAKTTDLPNDVVIPSYRHYDFDHKVTVDVANPYFTVSNNLIYTADKSTVVGYAGNNNSRSAATITIDEGTSAIRENAFTGSEAL